MTTDDKVMLAAAASLFPCRPQGIEQRRLVGQLLIRGYSPAAIDLKFYDAFKKRLERPWLEKLYRRVHSSGKLRKIQERDDQLILSAGLARKAERVRRLGEYVDAIEPAALTAPAKVGIEYRRGIEQIKQEVEGLGLDVTIHPSDVWGQLLAEIRKLVTQRADVEPTDTGAGVPDAQQAGSDAE